MSNSEFRRDALSGDWILVASGREDYFEKVLAQRKKAIKKKTARQIADEIKSCPFEEPQKSGNPAVLIFSRKGREMDKNTTEEDWFIQIISNKYPAVETHYVQCPSQTKSGPYSTMEAVGFHEVVITRDHLRPIALLKKEEIEIVLNAYKKRYLTLVDKKCLRYIFIFHNSGEEAGASVSHPHSQIIALSTIPPDVRRSLDGWTRYFQKYKKCVHCTTLEWEMRQKKRIIYQNSDFVAVCPYAARVNFEVRIFPIKHAANFEEISQSETKNLAETFKHVFKKIYDNLEDPPYNFFIHTLPLRDYSGDYHWHIEIFPRISIWAGLELGTGIEVVYVAPEKAAKLLKNQERAE